MDENLYKIVLLGDSQTGKSCLAQRCIRGGDHISAPFPSLKSHKATIGLEIFRKTIELPGTPYNRFASHRILLVGAPAITIEIWDVGGSIALESRMSLNYLHGAHAVILCYDMTFYPSFENLQTWYSKIDRIYNGSAPPGTSAPTAKASTGGLHAGSPAASQFMNSVMASQVTSMGSVNAALLASGTLGSNTVLSQMSMSQSVVGSTTSPSHTTTLLMNVTTIPSTACMMYKIPFSILPSTKPVMVLVGNKSDLSYQRAVRADRHHAFAAERHLYSYFVSAKTGENVAAMCLQVAADLAGVTLQRPYLETVMNAAKATIQPQNAAPVELKPMAATGADKSNCVIQ